MELPAAMVMEVLLRLPLKCLCRCKCVSKTWCSIISEIKKLYCVRNLGIVISKFGCSTSSSLFQSRLGLNNPPTPFVKQQLGGCEYESAQIGFTEVINGLFCFYTPAPAGDLTLCNSYTFETRKLPLPKFYRWTHKSQFYLGFDPWTGSYKLLSLGCLRDHDVVIYREILTLGRVNDDEDISIGTWIKMCPIDFLPGIDVLYTPSVCINQFLYWLVECKKNTWKILAFNLTAHNLYDIRLPKHLTDLSTARIVNFRGSLAVGCLENVTADAVTLNLWEWNSRRCWIQHSITLPEEIVSCNRESWCSVGNLPTGEILLANPKVNDDADFTPIYSYDHSTREFQRFVVGKFPPCMVAAGEKSSLQISCVELDNSSHSLEALLHKCPISALLYFEKLRREREWFCRSTLEE